MKKKKKLKNKEKNYNKKKKNTVKLTEAKLNQVIRESIKNYIKENEETDWDDFDDEEDDWDGSWAGRGRTGEDYEENPESEEMIWKHYGNQNSHKDKHLNQSIKAKLSKAHRPRIHKHSFNIKYHKDNRYKIVFDIYTRIYPAIEIYNSALINSIF